MTRPCDEFHDSIDYQIGSPHSRIIWAPPFAAVAAHDRGSVAALWMPSATRMLACLAVRVAARAPYPGPRGRPAGSQLADHDGVVWLTAARWWMQGLLPPGEGSDRLLQRGVSHGSSGSDHVHDTDYHPEVWRLPPPPKRCLPWAPLLGVPARLSRRPQPAPPFKLQSVERRLPSRGAFLGCRQSGWAGSGCQIRIRGACRSAFECESLLQSQDSGKVLSGPCQHSPCRQAPQGRKTAVRAPSQSPGSLLDCWPVRFCFRSFNLRGSPRGGSPSVTAPISQIGASPVRRPVSRSAASQTGAPGGGSWSTLPLSPLAQGRDGGGGRGTSQLKNFKEKNRTAQKRYRARQKSKLQDSEERVAELAQQLQHLRTEKHSLAERNVKPAPVQSSGPPFWINPTALCVWRPDTGSGLSYLS